MAVKELAHHTYLVLPEGRVRREAGKAFADGVESLTKRIQLLLGGEMVDKALLQTLLTARCF
jgi:hypothetical protein